MVISIEQKKNLFIIKKRKKWLLIVLQSRSISFLEKMDDTTTIDFLNKKIIAKKITHQNIKLYQGLILN